MQIVIPMAGAGQRFRDAGYHIPKPLIPVGGVPIVVRAVQDLPEAKRIVFVCHSEHVAEYPVEQVLKTFFSQGEIVVAPGLTQGQACSVRLAIDSLAPDEDVLVAACDNTHVYDRDSLQTWFRRSDVDALIWAYRGEPRVLVRPEWYGWVRADEQGIVQEVSVKKPISTTPLRDPVVTGAFWFRTARLLRDSIDQLVAENRRVNNEFYLDSVLNVVLERGHRVGLFEITKYIGWGTPDDLEDYRRWERHFSHRASAA